MARAKRTQDRPFPWRCGSCDEKEVYRTRTSYKTTIKYEGRPYDVEISDLEVPTCRKCGEAVFDNHAGHQINAALREQLGLLQPEQIRAGRTELDLSQRDFAALLGVAEESVCRWETGAQIQSRVVDRQIRVFFEFPAVREALSGFGHGKTFGETARVSSPSDRSRADYQELLSVLTQRRVELRKLLEEMPAAAIPTMTREWTNVWFDCNSLWKAAAHYAHRASEDDVRLVTLLLGSSVHRAGARDRLRWVSSYFRKSSGGADPMLERLGWITQELENVPESEAVPLLENFSGLLGVWKRRMGEPLVEQLPEEEENTVE